MSGQFRSIQVLRGVAACGVVFLHAYGVGSSFSRMGGGGVDLFFVISGFIMATIPKRPTFLFDRFWRIYPLWWIAVTPWIIAESPPWPVLATSLTLWPVYGAMTLPALTVGWTLSFELLFYLAVACSLRFGVRALLAVFLIMLTGAVLTRAPIFDLLGNPMIIEFLLGAAIARLPKTKRLALPLLSAGVVLFVISPTWVFSFDLAVRAPTSAWRVLYWGIPAALVVYACLCAEKNFARRIWNMPVLLGDASYSIYLFHVAAISQLSLPWYAKFAVGIGTGLIAWKMIERPLLRLKPRKLALMLDSTAHS